MKYRNVVRDTVLKFESLSIIPLFPNLNYCLESKDNAIDMLEKKRLAYEHYDTINEADIIYLITSNGYMGTSCKLELGYAVAKGKLIYFSEPTFDISLDCYAKDFIPLDKVEKFLMI